LLAATAVGQPAPPPKAPPGTIVIRPKSPGEPTILPPPTITPPRTTTSGTVIFATDPDRPGFIVVRPQRNGGTFPPISEPLPLPRDDVPNLVIIRPKPGDPQATPKPGDPPTTEPTVGEPKDSKILLETWEVASAKGCKVGYFHVVVREYERNGKKMVYATKEMKLQIARFGQAVETWAEDTTIETPDGQVLATVMRQGIGKNQMLIIRGEVTGNKLKLTIEGAAKNTKEIDWPEGVLGISREATILKDKKLRPGESVGYSVFDARLTSIIQYTATAVKLEEVAVAGGKPQPLLRVRMDMAPIGDFKLPPGMIWFDPETLEQVKTEQDMPMFGGLMTVQRTTKEAALRPAAKLLDLAEAQSIVLARDIPNAQTADEIVYRFTLSGELPLEKAFIADRRQTMKIVDAKARIFDLQVSAVRKPVRPIEPPARLGKEFLSDCYFIDWDNEQVRKHAKEATAGLPANADNWRKAQAVEAWVHKNMKATEFSQAMATCGNVAKTLSGDCTEYSVLAAGMCRALGIPSRTAIGLVYAPPQRGSDKPTLAWHMWYEVWIEGDWLPLDAVLGAGSVGAAHLKVTDTSWHDEKAFTPLLPLLNLLGTSPKVEVQSVNAGRK